MTLRERLNLDKDPVFLVDGSAYVFRGYYTNQSMSRADGFPTNVLFMVLRLVLKILREQSPSHFAFILDGRGKNFRHRLYPEYKANRLATPEPLSAQIPPLIEAIRALGLHLSVSEDCEADDCIASLAARLAEKSPVIIVGADKDLRQCLRPGVFLWDPSGKDEKLISLQSFSEEFGFEPRYWPDYQALVGDSSDNIPGVPGIGAKGATTLMREFAGLEDLFSRLAAVPPALRKKLEGQDKIAFLSRELTTLKLDCCQTLGPDDLTPRPPKREELMAFMQEYDLRGLARELASMLRITEAKGGAGDLSLAKGFARESAQGAGGAGKAAAQGQGAQAGAAQSAPGLSMQGPAAQGRGREAAPSRSPGKDAGGKKTAPGESAQGFLWADPKLETAGQASLLGGLESLGGKDTDFLSPGLADFAKARPTELPQGKKLAVLFARELGPDKNDDRLLLGDGAKEVLLTPPEDPAERAGLAKKLESFLEGKELCVPGLKALVEAMPELSNLLREPGLGRCLDLSLAAWLLSPEEYDYGFKRLLRLWGAEAAGPDADENGRKNPSALALGMAELLGRRLKANSLAELLRDLEMPLIPVLWDMQEAGIGIDKTAFAAFLRETEQELEGLSTAIHAAAGREFNIRSARQLAEILYGDLALPGGRKTSGGQASTSQEALEKLQGKHPIIDKLLEYRKLEKLRSTYLDPLPRLTDAAGRLHTSFNQSSTATGRLSSSNPNLQNIPVRGPQGRRMRACFTAAPGQLLVSADYSQIELRVLAHLSQDPTLLDAFRKGEDIHSRTASLLFDLPQAEIGPDQRRSAKTINFGLIYGMGPQKLARDLNISMNEAKVFIERYFAKLTRLKEYFEQVEQDAREHGFVQTMTGRRRPCPEILSANQQLRSRARRQAINTCIQGSAADIIKLAMLHTAADQELKNLEARLILQIHDELLLECPEPNAKRAGARLAEIMSSVRPGGQELSVPLASDWGAGKNWGDAH